LEYLTKLDYPVEISVGKPVSGVHATIRLVVAA
jgi:hypothetical protein